VLPQFLPAHASLLDALVLANTLPVIGFCWLVLVVSGVHTLRRWITRRRVRRSLDALTGSTGRLRRQARRRRSLNRHPDSAAQFGS